MENPRMVYRSLADLSDCLKIVAIQVVLRFSFTKQNDWRSRSDYH